MKIILLIVSLFSTAWAFASAEDLARKLYTDKGDVEFVSKFFEVVELHRTKDPLLEGTGPSVREFSLDKMKFAFMINDSGETVDLVVFNWNLAVIEDFKMLPDFSSLYGSPVYLLPSVEKKTIATQGEKHDELTNFSYLMGGRTMEAQFRRGLPANVPLPEWLDTFPHPDYMKRSHPLRKTLDVETLPLLSPKKDLYTTMLSSIEHGPMVQASLDAQGGYIQVILGMMVHEMFHVKEGNDDILGLIKARDVEPDRKLLKQQLESSPRLRSLYSTYKNIIFSLGQQMEGAALMSDLATVISEIKNQYPEGWKFIWNYEFTEGFAEYASAYSMLHTGVTTLDEQVRYQITDTGNNFAYRTGAIGGLYLSEKLRIMPFDQNQDHQMSLWENILLNEGISATGSIEEIIVKHKGSPDDEEVERVIEYIVGTVMEMD